MALTCWGTLPPAEVVDGCVEVYREAFGQAPYHESPCQAEALRDRLDRYAKRDGFLLPVSSDDAEHVDGFALAVTAYPGDWWRDQAAACLGATKAARWLGQSCREVVHVAVDPDQQRRGRGRALMRALQSSATIATGVLSCHPAALAARQLYLNEGWEVLSTNFRTSPHQVGYWLMTRDLDDATPGPGAD